MTSGAGSAGGRLAASGEKPELPLLSDLDALLEELGAGDSPKAAVPPKPKTAPIFDNLAGGSPKASAIKTAKTTALSPDSDILDFVDALPNPGRQADAVAPARPLPEQGEHGRKNAELEEIDAFVNKLQPLSTTPRLQTAVHPEVASGAGPGKTNPAMTAATQAAQDIASILEDVDAATAAPQAEAPAVPPAPAAQSAPVPPAQGRLAPAPSAARTAQENDGIDMVELDAMLDQVLSVAPRNRRPGADRSVPEARAEAAAPPAGAGHEETASAPSGNIRPDADRSVPEARAGTTASPVGAGHEETASAPSGNIRPDADRSVPEAGAGTAASPAGAGHEETASAPSGNIRPDAAASTAGFAASGATGEPVSSEEEDVGAMLLEADLKQKNPAGYAVFSADGEPSAKNALLQTVKTVSAAGSAKEAGAVQFSTHPAPGIDPAALSRAQAEIRRLTREITGLRVENRDFKNRITSLSSEMQDLRDNMDKHAARAAAKVIREELMTAISAELE
jgi:hypothetical protein